jgi:hypothetical protein
VPKVLPKEKLSPTSAVSGEISKTALPMLPKPPVADPTIVRNVLVNVVPTLIDAVLLDTPTMEAATLPLIVTAAVAGTAVSVVAAIAPKSATNFITYLQEISKNITGTLGSRSCKNRSIFGFRSFTMI